MRSRRTPTLSTVPQTRQGILPVHWFSRKGIHLTPAAKCDAELDFGWPQRFTAAVNGLPLAPRAPSLFRARREKSSPGGASELSPALQRWESGRDDSSPGEPALSAVEGTEFSRTLLRTDVSVYCRALHESPRNPTPETTVESHPQKTKAR